MLLLWWGDLSPAGIASIALKGRKSVDQVLDRAAELNLRGARKLRARTPRQSGGGAVSKKPRRLTGWQKLNRDASSNGAHDRRFVPGRVLPPLPSAPATAIATLPRRQRPKETLAAAEYTVSLEAAAALLASGPLATSTLVKRLGYPAATIEHVLGADEWFEFAGERWHLTSLGVQENRRE